MQLNTTNVILTLLGVTLVLCFVLTIIDKSHNYNIETFDPVVDAITSQLQKETPDQLKSTIKTLQQRLIDYGYAPDLNNYVTKSELNPNSGKCLVDTAEDRDKYISKSDIPTPGPRVDLSQYVKKSSIPPEKVCPPVPEIDYSAYVKKSTLPPLTKCPPCIAPQVKVSAGLCRACPPAPTCPAPAPCPQLECPPPSPCPTLGACRPCDEIRYIKVPAVITKTITLDSYGNVLSQNVDSGNVVPTQVPQSTQPLQQYIQVPQYDKDYQDDQVSQVSKYQKVQNSLMNSLFGSSSVTEAALIPSTTFPSTTFPSTTFPSMTSIPNTTLAQTLATVSNSNNTDRDRDRNRNHSFCPPPDLNSEFKSYGIYGR